MKEPYHRYGFFILQKISIMSNHKFVELSMDELQMVQDLAYQIWPSTFATILTEKQIDYMLTWMYSLEKLKSCHAAGHVFYSVEWKGEAVGFFHLQKNEPETGDLRIHKLYLLPNLQGTGLGRKMINEIDGLGQKWGLNQLHLNVNRFNKATQFYLHLGFQIERSEDIDIGEGYLMEDYVLTKSINH